jgi:hypothetical protein
MSSDQTNLTSSEAMFHNILVERPALLYDMQGSNSRLQGARDSEAFVLPRMLGRTLTFRPPLAFRKEDLRASTTTCLLSIIPPFHLLAFVASGDSPSLTLQVLYDYHISSIFRLFFSVNLLSARGIPSRSRQNFSMAPAAILCGKSPQLGEFMVKNLAPKIDGMSLHYI